LSFVHLLFYSKRHELTVGQQPISVHPCRGLASPSVFFALGLEECQGGTIWLAVMVWFDGEHTVPIRNFLDGEAFEPETIHSMGEALTGACRALGLADRDDP
jgi:hypothetical protein